MLAVVIQRAPDGSFLDETAKSYEIYRPDEDQGALIAEFAKWAAQRIHEERMEAARRAQE